MNRRVLMLLLGLVLLTAACARVTGAGGQSTSAGPSNGRPFPPLTIGEDQRGQTVSVHAGQQLTVQLGAPFALPQGVSPTVGYPSGLLSFSKDQTGTYIFTSHSPGTGRVWIAAPGCKPGPAKGFATPGETGAAKPFCPVLGPAASTGEPFTASFIYAVTVQVSRSGSRARAFAQRGARYRIGSSAFDDRPEDRRDDNRVVGVAEHHELVSPGREAMSLAP